MSKEFYNKVLKAADKMVASSSTSVEQDFWFNVVKNVNIKGL